MPGASRSGADGKIMMLADGNGDFAREIGLEFDSDPGRHGQALQALFDDRRRWRGQGAQCRGQAGRQCVGRRYGSGQL